MEEEEQSSSNLFPIRSVDYFIINILQYYPAKKMSREKIYLHRISSRYME